MHPATWSGSNASSLDRPRRAVVATDPNVEPTGYGLGRHGWISVTLPDNASEQRWQEIEEWVRTSYTMVAPKKLARIVIEEDACP